MFKIHTDTYYNAEKKTWHGPCKKELYGNQITLGEVALYMFSQNPSKIVQVEDTSNLTLTAAELLQQSRNIAINLLKLGIRSKDIVGIYAGNCRHLCAVVLAALLCGAPTNALFPGFDRENVGLIFKVTTPKVIFCEVENYDILKSACANIKLNAKIYTINGRIENVASVEELMQPVEENLDDFDYPCYKLTGNDTAVVICSSGTTGIPKGVMCSHRGIMDLNIFQNVDSNSVLFTFSPLYWISGVWTLLASLKHCVRRVITTKPYDPEYFCALIEKHGITHALMPSNQLNELVMNTPSRAREQLQSIQSMFSGGSKVPRLTVEKIHEIIGDKLLVCYGMTELMTMASGNSCVKHSDSVGKLMPNMQIRIVNDEGLQLGINETGILQFKNKFDWLGYYNNAEASKKTKTADGWVTTNDLVYFDEQGFLYIRSRETDVFKCNNFQIYPEIIEDVLFRLPGVAEACVFGVPDFAAGHLSACAIVRSSAQQLSASDIIEHVKQHLSAAYHLGGGVYFVHSIPKTASGKIQRRKMLAAIKELNPC